MLFIVVLIVFNAVPFATSMLNDARVAARNIRKRQLLYYICGVYPTQYYSHNPCTFYNNPWSRCCGGGGQQPSVRCYYDSQCSQYGLQPISCINGCCCTVPTVPIIPTVPTIATITPPSVGLGYCYDGQRSEVRCTVRGQCAAEQTCMNNLCCPTTDKQYLYACGGIAALGSCSRNGSCSNSFVCTASNYCCECAFGRTGGFCSQGCAAGYTCSANGYCCPSCPNGEVPYGSCYNGMCASGYSCRPGNICCSGQTPLARYRFVDYHR